MIDWIEPAEYIILVDWNVLWNASFYVELDPKAENVPWIEVSEKYI